MEGKKKKIIRDTTNASINETRVKKQKINLQIEFILQ